jgi:hypothetical protein
VSIGAADETAGKTLKAWNLDEVKEIGNKALSMEIYAKQARMANWSATAPIFASAPSGALAKWTKNDKAGKLAAGPKKGGSRRDPPKKLSNPAYLAKRSIDKNLADRGRQRHASAEVRGRVEKGAEAAARRWYAGSVGSYAVERDNGAITMRISSAVIGGCW